MCTCAWNWSRWSRPNARVRRRGRKFASFRSNRATRHWPRPRREVYIYTRDLDPLLFDTEAALDALKRVAIRGRGASIRVLIQDPQQAIRRGHRLVTLAQRLTSAILLRTPTQAEDLQYASAFVLNDAYGLYFRTLGTRFDGEVVNHAPGRHAQLLEYFRQVWERSETSEELRQLAI